MDEVTKEVEKVEEDTTVLTEEQEKLIYDATSGNDVTEDNTDDKPEEIETLEEVDYDPNDPGLNIEPTEQDYHKTFKDNNLTDEEGTAVYKTILDYKAGKKINYYEALPKQFQDLADAIKALALQNGHPITRIEASKHVLDQLINDAQFEAAFNQIQQEFDDLQKEFDTEYGKIFTDAYEEIFSKLDEIEQSDPEQAEKIRKVKEEFEAAKTFSRVKEHIKALNMNKLRKKADNRFGDEVYYFNKKVNVTDVKIPDIGAFPAIISTWLPQYNGIQIKRAVMAIMSQCDVLDVEHNMLDLVYVYRLVNNIYACRFIEKTDAGYASELFGNLSSVIDLIDERLAE